MDSSITPPFDYRSARRQFSRIGFAVAAMLLTNVALQLAGVSLVQIYLPDYAEESWMLWLLATIPNYLFAFPLFIIITRKIPAEAPGQVSIRGKDWLTYLMISFATLYAGNFVSSILVSIYSLVTGNTPENAVSQMLMGSSVIINIIVVGIIAPVVEEVIFRKIILDRTRKYGEKTALFLSALIFGLSHLNVYQMFYAFGIGLVLGFVYLRYGKLIHTIMIHFVINIISAAAAPLIQKATENITLILEKYQDQAYTQSLIDSGEIAGAFLSDLGGVVPWFAIIMTYSGLLLSFAVAGLVLFLTSRQIYRLGRREGDIPAKYVGATVYQNAGIITMIIICTVLTAAMLYMS